MKKLIFILIVLLLLHLAHAQGTIYFSNLSQSSAGSTAIGQDSRIAQAFNPQAGSSGYFGSYVLNSIQLSMNDGSGNPGGFAVSIYTGPRIPQVLVGNLDGSADPATAGIYTYTASGITLLTGNNYFIVVTAATSLATGAFEWSTASSTSSSGQWPLFNYYYSSANGSTWSGPLTSGNPFQFAIAATPVPEPSAWALLAVSGLLFLNQSRKNR